MPSRSPGWFGIDAAVQQQPVRAVQPLDDARGGRRLLDRQRLALARRRHERQHHQVGVRVQEDVLHELVGADAVQVVELARPAVRRAARVARHAGERPRARRQALQPGAGRVHEMALHVEDELVAVERRARELQVERGVRRARRRSRRCGRPSAYAAFIASSVVAAPARRHEEAAARQPEPLRVRARRLVRDRAAPRDARGASGIGAYSPLVVVSSLIGRRRPSGSFWKRIGRSPGWIRRTNIAERFAHREPMRPRFPIPRICPADCHRGTAPYTPPPRQRREARDGDEEAIHSEAEGGRRTRSRRATKSAAARRSAARLALVKNAAEDDRRPSRTASSAPVSRRRWAPSSTSTASATSPRPSILKCQWDRALFGAEMGDRTRLAYWVDRERYPSPEEATCADGERLRPPEPEWPDIGGASIKSAREERAAASGRPAPPRRHRGEDARRQRAAEGAATSARRCCRSSRCARS